MEEYIETIYKSRENNNKIKNKYTNTKIDELLKSEDIISLLSQKDAEYIGLSSEYWENKLPSNMMIYSRVVGSENKEYCTYELPFTQENYSLLYRIGRKMYDEHAIQKYEIAVFYGNNFVWHTRPDKYKFKIDPVGNELCKTIYNEINYLKENTLSKIEEVYQKVQNEKWEGVTHEQITATMEEEEDMER